jgi:hypothetical protein
MIDFKKEASRMDLDKAVTGFLTSGMEEMASTVMEAMGTDTLGELDPIWQGVTDVLVGHNAVAIAGQDGSLHLYRFTLERIL